MLEIQLASMVPDWLYPIAATTLENFQKAVVAPFYSTRRIFVGFLLTSALFAVFSYVYYSHKDKAPTSIKGFFSFLLPKRIYFSSSALLDLKIYLANTFARGLLSPIIALISVSSFTYGTNLILSSNWESPNFSSGPWGYYLFALIYLLVADFAYYVAHTTSHKVPFLWQLHALHHSSKVMTPMTLYRTHPIDAIFFKGIKNVIQGVLLGILLFLFMGKVAIYKIFGMNFIYFVFTFAGSNLRHSHVWISWGHILNHIFISPAHHQLHHSARMKHWAKNNGQVFAIWDWMFGTLVLPTEENRKNLVLGLTLKGDDPHIDLKAAYFKPLRIMWGMIKTRKMQHYDAATGPA